MSQPDLRTIEADAIAYLRQHLGDRTPEYLVLEGEFAESPLEGEGRTFLFSFDLAPGPGVTAAACEAFEPKHFVAVGETTPNFFPAYGLSLPPRSSPSAATVWWTEPSNATTARRTAR